MTKSIIFFRTLIEEINRRKEYNVNYSIQLSTGSTVRILVKISKV